MYWTDAGTTHNMHALLLTGIEDGRVQIENPWGIEESFPIEAFYDRLLRATLPE